MKVICEYCQARCRIDEAKIPAAGAHVRCPSCHKVFFLNPEDDRIQEQEQTAEATLLPDESETELQAEKPPASEVMADKPAVQAKPRPATKSTTIRLQRFITSRPLVISLAVTVLIEIILLILWGAGQQPAIQSKSSPLSIPTISIQIKNQLIQEITSHSLVGNAAINQQGHELSLTLLVDQSTPPAYALKLGRQFVENLKRLTGTRKPDKNLTDFPTYQFHLFVYYPNGREVTDKLSNTGDIRDN
ncbi:MAG: zinc-ribbon domain-containing protein [Pseudomonadota bacterium]|nr:zinc-ribbon domain-containing protein [Pseudomonadota bacterium]